MIWIYGSGNVSDGSAMIERTLKREESPIGGTHAFEGRNREEISVSKRKELTRVKGR